MADQCEEDRQSRILFTSGTGLRVAAAGSSKERDVRERPANKLPLLFTLVYSVARDSRWLALVRFAACVLFTLKAHR